MKEPVFEDILKAKRDYYGFTEAAISFAAEEYNRQCILFKNGTVLNLPKNTKSQKRGENTEGIFYSPVKRYFFRDIDHNGNFSGGKSYHAAGLICEFNAKSISEPTQSGKDVTVMFIKPFLGYVEYTYRSFSEIEIFEVQDCEWKHLKDQFDLFNNL